MIFPLNILRQTEPEKLNVINKIVVCKLLSAIFSMHRKQNQIRTIVEEALPQLFILRLKHSCGIKRIMRKGYDSMIVMDIYSFKEFCIPYFYTCSFRIDSTVPYQTLNFETIKKDIRFLLTKFKR